MVPVQTRHNQLLPFFTDSGTIIGLSAVLFGLVWILTTPGVMDALIEGIDNMAIAYLKDRGKYHEIVIVTKDTKNAVETEDDAGDDLGI